MKDLLIVEDDPTLGEGIRLALQAPELRPQLCRSLADAGVCLSPPELRSADPGHQPA